MKKFLLLSFAILFAFAVNAQKFGVKAGYGMSGYLINFYSPAGSGMSTGFNAGLLAELDLEVIGVRADLSFVQMGSDYDSRNEADADWPSRPVMEYDYKENVNYLNLGVSVKKGFGPAYLVLGPYFGYAISGNDKNTVDFVSADLTDWVYNVDIFSEPNTDFNPLLEIY